MKKDIVDALKKAKKDTGLISWAASDYMFHPFIDTTGKSFARLGCRCVESYNRLYL